MGNWKCSGCGLVNFAEGSECARCGAAADASSSSSGDDDDAATDAGGGEKRGFGKRVSWVLGMTCVTLFVCYVSLLLTSEPASWEQAQKVERAVGLLQEKGFGREAFVLRRLVNFRTTDNWWNMQVGHHDAYAATNFPFEVVTLYPEFFDAATDDTERAAILLHESYHLKGSGEAAALEGVWKSKGRLGWTADKYGETKVWRNTRELTEQHAPRFFRCGDDAHSDCYP